MPSPKRRSGRPDEATLPSHMPALIVSEEGEVSIVFASPDMDNITLPSAVDASTDVTPDDIQQLNNILFGSSQPNSSSNNQVDVTEQSERLTTTSEDHTSTMDNSSITPEIYTDGPPPDPLSSNLTAAQQANRLRNAKKDREAEWARERAKFAIIQRDGIPCDPPCLKCASPLAENRLKLGHKCMILLSVSSKCGCCLVNHTTCTQTGWKEEFRGQQMEEEKKRKPGTRGRQVQVRKEKGRQKGWESRQAVENFEGGEGKEGEEQQGNSFVPPLALVNFIRRINNVTDTAPPRQTDHETTDESIQDHSAIYHPLAGEYPYSMAAPALPNTTYTEPAPPYQAMSTPGIGSIPLGPVPEGYMSWGDYMGETARQREPRSRGEERKKYEYPEPE